MNVKYINSHIDCFCVFKKGKTPNDKLKNMKKGDAQYCVKVKTKEQDEIYVIKYYGLETIGNIVDGKKSYSLTTESQELLDEVNAAFQSGDAEIEHSSSLRERLDLELNS
jgi:hypothetical protein